MKKWKVTALAMLLCIGMLSGCGASYAADESTVFIKKDGSVVTTDVEEFDADTYDEDGLKSYIDEAISTYNEQNGAETIKLKSLSVKDGKATLTITYASAGDYENFTGIPLFTGSVAEALAAGYSFDDTFAKVKDGAILACDDVSEFLDEAGYKVVIIRGNARVQVKGTVAYVTAANTTYVDAKTIAIAEGTSIFPSEPAERVDDTESATEVIGTQAEEAAEEENSGSVSEDDLLSAAGEDSEVVFDFPEEEEAGDEESQVSQVFTYIIYK
jgi:hypothetical protein